MELAVSDSPLSRRLLSEGRLEIDYLETTGPFVDTALSQFPKQRFLLHNSIWDWSLAHPEALKQKDVLLLTKKRLELTKSPWLSIHLGFSAAEVAYNNGMRALTPGLPKHELFRVISSNVNDLQRYLSVPLLLENLDYNSGAAYEHICAPEFIADILNETNAYFLLDLAHMQVSASRLGYPVKNYIDILPLDKVRQIHLSGPRYETHYLHDTHEPLREEDYRLLEQVLSKTNPWAITLEYQRDEHQLLEQIKTLKTYL